MSKKKDNYFQVEVCPDCGTQLKWFLLDAEDEKEIFGCPKCGKVVSRKQSAKANE